jgi:hypothetical protein
MTAAAMAQITLPALRHRTPQNGTIYSVFFSIFIL